MIRVGLSRYAPPQLRRRLPFLGRYHNCRYDRRTGAWQIVQG